MIHCEPHHTRKIQDILFVTSQNEYRRTSKGQRRHSETYPSRILDANLLQFLQKLLRMPKDEIKQVHSKYWAAWQELCPTPAGGGLHLVALAEPSTGVAVTKNGIPSEDSKREPSRLQQMAHCMQCKTRAMPIVASLVENKEDAAVPRTIQCLSASGAPWHVPFASSRASI